MTDTTQAQVDALLKELRNHCGLPELDECCMGEVAAAEITRLRATLKDAESMAAGTIDHIEKKNQEIARLREERAEMLAALKVARDHIGAAPTINAAGQDCFLDTLRLLTPIETLITRAEGRQS